MLAFLSPSLTPEELYKLGEETDGPGLKSIPAVQEVESVYDLTERDFDDLKLYHLGPCRALPQYILQPQAWTKVLPPHFLAARQHAMLRAQDWEARQGPSGAAPHQPPMVPPPQGAELPQLVVDEDGFPPVQQRHSHSNVGVSYSFEESDPGPSLAAEFQREVEEEGAFHDTISAP
jgi:hypothetical protein